MCHHSNDVKFDSFAVDFNVFTRTEEKFTVQKKLMKFSDTLTLNTWYPSEPPPGMTDCCPPMLLLLNSFSDYLYIEKNGLVENIILVNMFVS